MATATLWNNISDEYLKQSKDIITVKKRLKTFLFNGYYCSDVVC